METPTGFRDYAWQDSLQRRKLIKVVEEVFLRAGFLPMEHPSVQFLSVLTAKSGEEVKKEIFKIEGEDIGLRFDHTVGLARYAGQEKGLRLPLKRYTIDRAWRNEEPQRGRYREFLQADIDVVGVKDPSADLEVLLTVSDALSALGVETQLLINNREFLDAFAEKQGFSSLKQEVYRLMDKLDKIGKEQVLEQLSQICDVSAVEPLFDISLEEVRDYSEGAYESLSFLLASAEGKFAPYIIRGFDYYTGNVFEFKEKSGLTVAAGGRYDTLISLYGKDLPAVGAGIGLDRIWALFGSPSRKPFAPFYVCTFSETWKEAFSIVRKLRKEGVACDISYGGRSLRKQMDYARAMGYRYVLIVGKEELSTGKLKLKDFDTGEERVVSTEELHSLATSL